jgi:hypothetical protein
MKKKEDGSANLVNKSFRREFNSSYITEMNIKG